ncbi:Outer membrane protein TolC [Persephonella hydrogeniphila]|uniref:Outer membrane protein TolC n=1 Tax=Persephonella hydrogeniphila TaxID=198703 RepID=A0A285N1H4_9AQUI|nr:TolC family protein [Persephonella hydrogeniphila]SNZ02773.1 Outer membrane protein TolC [Persephonella hydrogeniphila]
MRKIFTFFLIFFCTAYSLTVEEAIQLAEKNHPYLLQQKSTLGSYRYDYISSYGSFLPSVSVDYTYSRYRNSEDYFSRNYSLTFYWTVYNAGQNILINRIKKAMFSSFEKNFEETLLDIHYQVKKAYYQACADKEILRFRKIQLKAAQKNFDMAKKKLKLGLVKKSDYLQAKVRLENVRYMLVQAENEYKKSIANLNSLIGFPIDRKTEVDSTVIVKFEDDKIPDFDTIKKLALKRPIFKQYRYDLKASELQVKQSLLSFTPSVYLSYSINRDYSSLYGSSDYNTFRVGLSWTVFEGLKRYYNYLSARENERSYRYRLKELKRQIILNLYSTYLDLKTAYKNVNVAKTLLKEAEHNYKQALGEYKVGKGDIISLVTAESALADAHETYVQSLLNIAITRAVLERGIGMEKIPSGKEK